MLIDKRDLLPGVRLIYVNTDKFKTGVFSVWIKSALDSNTAAAHAVIPHVLLRGSKSLPDMEQISAALEEMYGSSISPINRKIGETQYVGFLGSFPDDKFLPEGTKVAAPVISLLFDLLLRPNTHGGLLLQEYVNSERDKHIEQILSLKNDKGAYAQIRLLDKMFEGEAYAISAMGTAPEAKSINYLKLTKIYRELIQTAPIDIIYCGSMPIDDLLSVLTEELAVLPRTVIKNLPETEIKFPSEDFVPRTVFEDEDTEQEKLIVGWRLGDYMKNPDLASLMVFNSVFGGDMSSKLFVNVREKMSLCYNISSFVDRFKGVLFASCGISEDDYDAALSEIFNQLDAIRRGEISEFEMSAAIQSCVSSYRSVADSAYSMQSFILNQLASSQFMLPLELSELCMRVTPADLAGIADSVVLDTVYLMRDNKTSENAKDTDDND